MHSPQFNLFLRSSYKVYIIKLRKFECKKRGVIFMPTYDLFCQKCKKDFSLTLRIKDYEKKEFACPQCKGKEITRIPSMFMAKTSKKS